MTEYPLLFNAMQVLIVLFGVPAVFLSQSPSAHSRKWAPVLGLLGQPAWFYIAYATSSFGIAVLCGMYTISWYRGFHHQWVRPIKRAIDEHRMKEGMTEAAKQKHNL